jgi:Flp pilus assembly protein TadD
MTALKGSVLKGGVWTGLALVRSSAIALIQLGIAATLVQAEPSPSSKPSVASGVDCAARLTELSTLARDPKSDLGRYRVLVEQCPNAPEAHYALGVALKNGGHLEEARAALQRALDLRDIVPYRIALGVVSLELGKLEDAAALFAKASELDPRSVAALQGRSVVAAQQGDLGGAADFIERAIAIDSSNSTLVFNRAALRERAGKRNEAIGDYERVTVLDPTQVIAWCRLGMLRYTSGDPQGALTALTECSERGAAVGDAAGGSSEIAKQVTEAGAYLARALGETGESERAELTLRRLIERAPSDASLKVALAGLYIRLKRFEQALSHAQAATMLSANDQRAWATLGEAALGLGDNVEAQSAFEKARSLGGERNPEVLNNLGVLKLRLGRQEEAKELFRAALRIDQQFEAARVNLESIQ